MSAPHPAPSFDLVRLGELTDREREVLRLLASGHTVKSIAVLLGRSEASIHERLRDARRKTGVGSSRELARLLDARQAGPEVAGDQKSWDRKIDLAAHRSAADAGEAPAAAGRWLKKGTIMLLAAIPLAAAAGLALTGTGPLHSPAFVAVGHATAARPSPLVGRWALDTDRIPAAERPLRVTIAFRPAGEGAWMTQVEIVAPDGTVQRAVSTARPDGIAVPVTGTMTAIDTVSLRQPAPGTLVMTLGKNGAPVSTRVYTVAKDRRTMTETIVWASGGLPGLETTTFRRMD